jgi:4-hydroxybenzoate polyprenyltransferase
MAYIARMDGVFRKIRTLLELIRFSHTVFALPFALIGMMLAARGIPGWRVIGWIIAACFFARSAAMAFNRLADHQLDALNPRTSARALPAGLISRRAVWIFMLACCAGFVLCAGMLNTLCLMLSPAALAVLLGYSLTKRVTNLSHVALGLALGIAPIGAWIAVSGSLAWTPILLGAGVTLWTAGFDIIYSCQDYEHDLKTTLYSIPKALGIPKALRVSALLHLCAFTAFLGVYWAGALGWFYLTGILLVGALLFYEHRLVRPDDLSRVNAAFFTVNGVISIGLFLACSLDFLFGLAR